MIVVAQARKSWCRTESGLQAHPPLSLLEAIDSFVWIAPLRRIRVMGFLQTFIAFHDSALRSRRSFRNGAKWFSTVATVSPSNFATWQRLARPDEHEGVPVSVRKPSCAK